METNLIGQSNADDSKYQALLQKLLNEKKQTKKCHKEPSLCFKQHKSHLMYTIKSVNNHI